MNFQRILIRATNWVGDAVMCVPALEAIRARFPKAHIAVLARPWVAGLYGPELADEVIPYTAGRGFRDLADNSYTGDARFRGAFTFQRAHNEFSFGRGEWSILDYSHGGPSSRCSYSVLSCKFRNSDYGV